MYKTNIFSGWILGSKTNSSECMYFFESQEIYLETRAVSWVHQVQHSRGKRWGSTGGWQLPQKILARNFFYLIHSRFCLKKCLSITQEWREKGGIKECTNAMWTVELRKGRSLHIIYLKRDVHLPGKRIQRCTSWAWQGAKVILARKYLCTCPFGVNPGEILLSHCVTKELVDRSRNWRDFFTISSSSALNGSWNLVRAEFAHKKNEGEKLHKLPVGPQKRWIKAYASAIKGKSHLQILGRNFGFI